MLLKQYFDPESFTYTYLIADEKTSQAALIDTVNTQAEFYLEQLRDLNVRCVHVLDTHTHADHISANGLLREKIGCTTWLGVESNSTCVSRRFKDKDIIQVGNIKIEAIHTPGHTDDSYSFHVVDGRQHYLFTGDTLLINGSGRTDFQNGNAHDQYNSIFNKLLQYSENTVVYPAHDYRGEARSTIGDEKKNNPRLQVSGEDEYVAIMQNLKLANPKMMDIAVPANRVCGKVV